MLATGALALAGVSQAAPDAGIRSRKVSGSRGARERLHPGRRGMPGALPPAVRRGRHLPRRVREVRGSDAADVPRAGHRRGAELATAEGHRPCLRSGLPGLRGRLQAARGTPRRVPALHGGLPQLRLGLREGLGLRRAAGPGPLPAVQGRSGRPPCGATLRCRASGVRGTPTGRREAGTVHGPSRHPDRLVSSTLATRDHLFSAAYDELRRLAASVRREDPAPPSSPTALVNEAWLKLAASPEFAATSPLHFKRIAARAMRQVLVEAARRRTRRKRGGGAPLVTFDEDTAAAGGRRRSRSGPGQRAGGAGPARAAPGARSSRAGSSAGWTSPRPARSSACPRRPCCATGAPPEAWLAHELRQATLNATIRPGARWQRIQELFHAAVGAARSASGARSSSRAPTETRRWSPRCRGLLDEDRAARSLLDRASPTSPRPARIAAAAGRREWALSHRARARRGRDGRGLPRRARRPGQPRGHQDAARRVALARAARALRRRAADAGAAGPPRHRAAATTPGRSPTARRGS